MTDPRRPPRFRGWRIVALATIAGALTAPGQTIGVSVFIDHLVADLGLGRSQVSGAYLVGTLAGAAALPAIGRRIDDRGVRRSMTWIALAFGVALANMAAVRGLFWLAVGFAGIRMFGQGALSLVARVSVSLWFDRRRGLALGILIPAISALMALAPVVLNGAIDVWGWRNTWLAAAAVVVAVVVPIARFGMVDHPADVGQMPDGRSTGVPGVPGAPESDAPVAPERSATRGEAVRSPGFIVLAAVSSVMSMMVTGLNFHQIRLLGEAGLSRGEAAVMFLPQVLGATVVGLTFGVLSDRRIGPYLPALTMVWLAAAHILGATATNSAMVVLYAVALGASIGSISTVSSTLVPRWFGIAHLGSIQGILTFAGVASSALGPLAVSIGASAAGGYQAASLVFAVVPVVVGIAAWLWRPRQPERRRDPVADLVG